MGEKLISDASHCIVSYNLHGLNQGREMLELLCNDMRAAIILVQEHWLGPDMLYKMNLLSTNYAAFGISAMEDELNCNILRGRPYGGTAILVRSDLLSVCNVLLCTDRVVAIRVCDLIIINVAYIFLVCLI